MKEVTLKNDEILELINNLSGVLINPKTNEKYYTGLLSEDIKESCKRILKRNFDKLAPVYDSIVGELDKIELEELSEEDKKTKKLEFLSETVDFHLETVKEEYVYDFKRKTYEGIVFPSYNYELIDKIVE